MAIKWSKRPVPAGRPPRRGTAPTCPFCHQDTERPALISEGFSVEAKMGGRCPCGAVYVIDETGKAGGETLLDSLALACAGDLDRALALDSDRDYQVDKRIYRGGANTMGLARVGSAYVTPTAWFIKLRLDAKA